MNDLSSLRAALARMRLNASPENPSARELANRLISTGLRYRHVARHLEEVSKRAGSELELRMLDSATALDEHADACHREALRLVEPAFTSMPGVECRLCQGTGTAMLAGPPIAPGKPLEERTISILVGPCLCREAP